MKIKCLSLQSSKDKWFVEALAVFEKKLKPFCHFELHLLKAKSGERKQREFKREKESEVLLAKIKPNDFVILCDERGKTFTSQKFSKQIVSWVESGHNELVFVVGGAYGVSEELRKRANCVWSLSEMVMNHQVAQVVVLEQIYRAFSIWKGLPYHNE